MLLAELCSQAVDYPKNGKPVDISDLPRSLSRFKPDWHQAEVSGPRENDYYESDRALGHLFRNIELMPTQKGVPLDVPTKPTNPDMDPICLAIAPRVQHVLLDYVAPSSISTVGSMAGSDAGIDGAIDTTPQALFAKYARELRYIRVTHTLTDAPTDILTEEEVFIGAILSNCTQARWRKGRTYYMKLHTSMLVKDIRQRLVADPTKADPQTLKQGLKAAWDAYVWALRMQAERGTGQDGGEMEGIQSFGWVVLGVVLDCLQKLLGDLAPVPSQPLPTPPRTASPSPPPHMSREGSGRDRGGRGGKFGRTPGDRGNQGGQGARPGGVRGGGGRSGGRDGGGGGGARKGGGGGGARKER